MTDDMDAKMADACSEALHEMRYMDAQGSVLPIWAHVDALMAALRPLIDARVKAAAEAGDQWNDLANELRNLPAGMGFKVVSMSAEPGSVYGKTVPRYRAAVWSSATGDYFATGETPADAIRASYTKFSQPEDDGA